MIQKLAVAGTVIGGVAIGLMWPTGNSTARSAGGSEFTIVRSSDHHYYADGKVNGHTVHFMIDTGAGETALTEADAHQIGISVDPSNYQVLGDGASGMVRGQYVQLKSIEVAGIRQDDPKAVVVPGATVSLLGQPFLERIDEIVISKGEMRLKTEGRS